MAEINHLSYFYHCICNFDQFSANVRFLCPLKTSENHRFSDVFWGYRNRKWAKLNFLPLSLVDKWSWLVTEFPISVQPRPQRIFSLEEEDEKGFFFFFPKLLQGRGWFLLLSSWIKLKLPGWCHHQSAPFIKEHYWH